MDYEEYIKSDKWEARKKEFKKGKIFVCDACQMAIGVIHVHHKSYSSFGNEDDKDLCFMCDDCHKYIHNFSLQDGNRLVYKYGEIKRLQKQLQLLPRRLKEAKKELKKEASRAYRQKRK